MSERADRNSALNRINPARRQTGQWLAISARHPERSVTPSKDLTEDEKRHGLGQNLRTNCAASRREMRVTDGHVGSNH